MTRKKVKLAYISNDLARKATFKKRKKGLMKKVSELSTLCGIEACAIIYSPYESQAEVWPSAVGVQRVLSEFKQLPEMEQSKKMVNQESFLRQRIAKANEQLKKLCKDNREKEMTQLMFQTLITATGKGGSRGGGGINLHSLNMMDLNDLGWLIDQNLKDIHKRVDSLSKAAAAATTAAMASSDHYSQYNVSQLSQFQAQVAGTSAAAAATAEAMGKMVGGGSVHAAAGAAEDHHHHRQASMETVQRQQWAMMDQLMMMNSQEQDQHVAFGGNDDIITMQQLPFGDNNNHNNNTINNALWPSSNNPFFP